MRAILFGVAVLAASCGTGLEGELAARLASADHPVLGSIQARDRVLHFRGGPDGPRFTVSDGSGRVLAQDLTADQLAAFDPLLLRAARGFALDVTPAARSTSDERPRQADVSPTLLLAD